MELNSILFTSPPSYVYWQRSWYWFHKLISGCRKFMELIQLAYTLNHHSSPKRDPELGEMRYLAGLRYYLFRLVMNTNYPLLCFKERLTEKGGIEGGETAKKGKTICKDWVRHDTV